MDKFFRLKENNTTYKIEILAGITTFLSMSYILIVNPSVLAEAGMDKDAVFMATIISSVIGCFLMGFLANLPIGQAPGMGINAFFTYTVVLSMGYSWQEGLLSVFISGIIFLIISLTKIRETIITIIPPALKNAVGIGIGFFISFIGLQSSGIIVASDSTLVTIGDFTNPITLLSILGVFLTLIFMKRGVTLALFYSMSIITVSGIIMQLVGFDLGITIPSSLISMPPSIEPVMGQLFINVDFKSLFVDLNFWIVVFSFLFIDFFDTTGLFIAVTKKGNLQNEDGTIKNSKNALKSDALATMSGAFFGTTSVTSFMESLSGILIGGRTGLTAIVIGICFLLASFLSPFLGLITPAVTAPALIIVGILMADGLADIDFSDLTNSASVFITIIMMLTSYSIAEGIAAGFITYVVCKVATKQYKDVHIIMYILCLLFLVHYIVK